MTSMFRITKSLEWCTELPTKDCPRKSPVFLANGNEGVFLFVLAEVGNSRNSTWYFELHLELKCMDTEFKPCSGKLKVGFSDEETFSLGNKTFEVSEPCKKEIWFVSVTDVQNKRPAKYTGGDLIKIFFLFDDSAHIKIREKVGTTSSALQFLDSDFSLENLSQDFGKMLHDGLDYDAEIKCDGHTWKVHKNVLSIRSKVLQAMLNSDMVEGRTGVITLQDMDVPTVQQFLNYLYCGKLQEMTIEAAKQFYEIGDKYAVEGLKKICTNYLLNNLTVENAFEILIFAIQHSDSGFKDSTIQFLIEKKVFMNDDVWRDFRESNPAIAFEVYDRFLKSEN